MRAFVGLVTPPSILGRGYCTVLTVFIYTAAVSSNSPWSFVSAGMEHMLGPHWMELFEFVGVSASKPLFYTGKRPFRLVSVHYFTTRVPPCKVLATPSGRGGGGGSTVLRA